MTIMMLVMIRYDDDVLMLQLFWTQMYQGRVERKVILMDVVINDVVVQQ